MTKLERFIKVYKWLYYKGVGNNQQEIAKAIAIDNSTLSQYLNGKLPVTNKVIRTICLVDTNINVNWVIEGEGNMFLNPVSENLPSTEIHTETDVDRRTEKLLHLIERSEERIDETNKMIQLLANTLNKVTESYDKHISELVQNREVVQGENIKLLSMLEQNQRILEKMCTAIHQ